MKQKDEPALLLSFFFYNFRAKEEAIMTIQRIYTAGQAVLKKKAETVQEITSEIKKLAYDMIETMIAARGVGLAAPQVGTSKRVIIVDEGYAEHDKLVNEGKLPEDSKPKFKAVVMINPEIIFSDGKFSMEEGCLSVPGYRAEVERFQHIKAKYLDLEGKECIIEGFDLLSVVIQHEIDHLNGVLFIDRISLIKKRTAIKKMERFLENVKDKEEEDNESRLYG